ncbi:MAG: VWA domain-containing protein [Pseudonocardiales bacterium]|nr:VWA domain-containing protein [Pseudonocardiales bacterium]
MGVQWPFVLLSLLFVPLLIGVYVWQLRRRRRQTVRHSSVALIRAAAPSQSAWKRHLPVALILGALALLGVAASRPHLSTEVPISDSAIILALDVSGSMCSTDVAPNRLTAAEAAVRDFVQRQDADTRIGLVVFSGFAQVTIAPTTERDALLRSLDTLTTGRGTAIGAAVLKSVDAIAEIDPEVSPSDPGSVTGATAPRARPPGTFAPEIVVLLTDGANTTGVEPVVAAKTAAERGVRVYPIGFGTSNPASIVCTAAQLGGRTFEGFGGRPAVSGTSTGGNNFLVADEATLRDVASATGGEYFSAGDADRLQSVLKDLPRNVATQERDIEVSVVPVALAAVLLLASLWAAARWTAFPN